ncbi:Ral GTPase-activating protein subunit alpha-2 [Mortierella antarctica]|nr:Ral GTPase-activating protein subunit alpha-2 [Mortierella antarctica]
MDPHGSTNQHPFDDFDHVRPLPPTEHADPPGPVPVAVPATASSRPTVVTTLSAKTSAVQLMASSPHPLTSDSSTSISTINTINTSHSMSTAHTATAAQTAGSDHSNTSSIHNSSSSNNSTVTHAPPQNTQNTQHSQHSQQSSGRHSIFSTSHSNSNPNPNSTHHSPHAPPIAPLQTSTTSLATTAAARFSQAFSPLLSSRRKSAAIDIPSTPDGHKSFSYSLSSSVHASPASLYAHTEGQPHSASQEHLSGAGPAGGSGHHQHQASDHRASHFESNLSKIASFSSPRSTNRARKTHPAGITHVPEESGYGSYATPPHTATAFHTGLASHFASASSSSQHRDHHDAGHRESKGSIVGGSSSIEKALKKAKVFLDEKAKSKARAASLWAFLDVAFEFDQAKFFQDHADQVFAVTHDSFWHQVDKFKQKPDRNNSLQSKEVVAVQKTLLLLRLIFLYLPDRMKSGWHKGAIANMLAQILCHKNHPRIRIFGFRLLLLWINDQTTEYPEAIYLFSNAISLDLFMYDGEDLSIDHASTSQTRLPAMSSGSTGRKSAKQAAQYFDLAFVNLNQELLKSDGPPICPNPSPPTFQDSIQLFQIFLANIVRMAYVAAGSTPPPGELESINSHYPLETDRETGDGIAVGFGIDAGLASARFMFDIIKKYYLVKVFPECARRLHLLKDEGKEFGYKSCPPTILRTIISFIIQYCLDKNEFNSPQRLTSPATPILKSIVFSSEINREMMHEIVRQGLSLPPGHPQYKDIVRGAVHIVGVWCLSGEEERPSFLRSSSTSRSHLSSSISSASLVSQDAGVSQPGSQQGLLNEPYSTANSFLKRYFQLLTNVFAESPSSQNDIGSNSSSEQLGAGGNHVKLDMDALFAQYRNVIGLFRAIMARGQIEMDAKSWEVLQSSLLMIQRRIMSLQEKFTAPSSISAVDDLASLIIETVLCAYSRCPNVSTPQWIALREVMTESLRWPQAVTQWARWSVRLTHILAQEVFQVDLEAQTSKPSQTAAAARHTRKMSDKLRHSRFLNSKTAENMMRHSIGGELLSSQGIPYPHHQNFPIAGLNAQERSSRRTNSVHYDPAKPGGGSSGANAYANSMYAPTLLGHMSFLPGRDLSREYNLNAARTDIGEVDEEESHDHPQMGSQISALTEALETGDEKLSRASSLSFHGPDSLHLDPIVERLSSLYGIFAAPEFVNISMKGRTAETILSVWKNIICSIGNPNDIQIPLVKTEVMLCLIDVWDLLNQTRTCQSLDATVIPPLYDFAPWFFEAAKSSSDGGVGLPAIYGGLCRMMSRRFDQDFDPEYYRLFYESVIQLLKDGHLRDGVNHYIRKQAIAILCSVSMLFYDFDNGMSGETSQQQSQRCTDGLSGADLLSYKTTFTRLVLDMTSAEASVKPLGKFWDTHSMLIQLCGMLVVNEWCSNLASCDIGMESELLVLVLEHLYWTEPSIVQSALEVLTTLSGMYQDHEDNGWMVLEMVLSHLLSAMQEHLKLFLNEPRRGNMIASFYRCLTDWLMVIPSNIFSETELSRWTFELIEIGLLSAAEPNPESERKKSLQAAKQLQQQTQQQLQQLQLLASRGRRPSFKHTGKAIHQHHRVMINSGPTTDAEVEQHIVKESAEATLTHLVHFLNHSPSFYGSDRPLVTLGMESSHGANKSSHGSSSSGNSSGSKSTRSSGTYGQAGKVGDLENQKIFALNDSILITLEEVPCTKQGIHRTRVIIRDETGRYAWDSEIFFREVLELEENTTRPRSSTQRPPGSRLSERFNSSGRRRKKEMASQLIWREGVKIREDEIFHAKPRVSSSSSSSSGVSLRSVSYASEAPLWETTGPKGFDGDRLDHLLHYIGEQHPDCLFDGKTPLNQLNNGMALSTEPKNASKSSSHSDQTGLNAIGNGHGSNGTGTLNKRSTIDFELDRHVQEESYYTRISDPQARAWYDKLVELRSSLIQADEEVEAYSGSNTLMSLVVNSNWAGAEGALEGHSSEDSTNATLIETDAQHKTLYEMAKKAAPTRRIRHENLDQIHAEAMDNEAYEQEPQDPQNQDQEEARDKVAANLRKEDAFCKAKAFQLVLPPEPERPLDSYQHSRLLLSHLGLLCFERFQEHNFVLLNPSASLDRDLKSLDKKSGRETFKIAILYVAQGQEGEQVILRNSKGSAAYNRFVQDLGWEVDLAEHSGYIGLLERNGSNGRTAMYYCSSTLEVIFHEVVRMPTDPDDPRQVKKKRHIGNDHVHIVWSEHLRAYDRNTIGGDFGNVLIVLTPVPDLKVEDGQLEIHTHTHDTDLQSKHSQSRQLVSVEIIRDMNLPVFGPLVDGMVVPMSQLARLVRQTAIHAARLATAPPPLPPTPPSASFTSLTYGNGVHSGAGGGGANGPSAPATGGNAQRSSGHQAHLNTGSIINSAMQGPQYHQSNPAVLHTPAASTVNVTSSGMGTSASSSSQATGAAVAGPGSAATGSHGPSELGSGVAGTAAASSSALLGASLSNLVNVGNGPNAASATSLISNTGASGSSGGFGVGAGGNQSTTGLGSNVSLGGSAGQMNGGTSAAAAVAANGTSHATAAAAGSQQQQQHHPVQVTASSVGPLASSLSTAGGGSSSVASTSTFSSSMLVMAHNAHPFRQRSLAIEQIARRHKVEKWTFQQFMEQVFGYSTVLHPHLHHRNH